MSAVSLIIEDSKSDPKPEVNELDRNAMGGTELMKYELFERLPSELLKQFQIIPSRVREIDPDRIPILWNHDLAGDPETEHLKNVSAEDLKFKKLVFVSHWQLQQFINYLNVPYSKSLVLQNAIEPIPDHTKPDDVINLCYHTTPHRGLELLVPVFKHLHDNVFPKLDIKKEVHLHVYSDFAIYGWESRNEQYKELFDECIEHSNITYHSTLSNDLMKKELEKMHIFAYPSIWQETSCLALIEAMSAGMLCVHSSYAALPETAANWTLLYPMSENHQQHCNMFADQLLSAVKMCDQPHIKERLEMQRRYTNGFYNWEVRALQWKALLEGLLQE
jgi:UDP-glucose:(glucosyl)LPS alpha-1,2-glucosyltransferase